MTRDEIKLVLFILVALVTGALFQDWRAKHPVPPPTPVPSKKGAKAPPVLKNRKEPPAPKAAEPE